MPPFLNQVMAPQNWPTFVLLTARLTGLMLAAPLWSMTALPRAARAAITVVLATLLLPSAPKTALGDRVLDLPLPMAMELVVGIVIGLTGAVLIQGVTLAGEVISLQMGLSLGPALSPMPDLQAPGIGQLKGLLALAIYVGVGGHLLLLKGLADSLQVLPPGTSMNLELGGRAAASMVGGLYTSAVQAAAPVMVALLMSNAALALLSRAVPQINTMMVSLPLTIGIGLVMLGTALPIVASIVTGWMRELPAGVDVLLHALAAH
jgi:flagellar biosynthetic protein FliR